MEKVKEKDGLPAEAINDRLLTALQVRRLLGNISRVTLWRYTTRKRDPLPRVRLEIGSPMKFPLNKVLLWIENQASNRARC